MPRKVKLRGVGEIPPTEWAVGALGFFLMLALLAYFLIQAIGAAPTPPNIVVNVDSIASRTAGFVAELSARNLGERTAAQIVIEGELVVNGAEVERRGIVLDYLPEQSVRRAALVFRHDPRLGELRVRAVSYREP